MQQDISSLEALVRDYVPPQEPNTCKLTLTWAQSVDARISAGLGLRTKLSGRHSHKMTHYMRTLHDAILVGWTTVVADDPKLNCRYPGAEGHPRPIILDSHLSWPAEEKMWAVLAGAKAKTGLAPYVLCKSADNAERVEAIEMVGGKVVRLPDLEWSTILNALANLELKNVMVEGGSRVIETALHSGFCHCIIVTVAPVFLGHNGISVSTSNRVDFVDAQWWREEGVPDTVMLARAGR